MENLAPGVENEGGINGKGRPNSDKDGRFPPYICFDDTKKCNMTGPESGLAKNE